LIVSAFNIIFKHYRFTGQKVTCKALPQASPTPPGAEKTTKPGIRPIQLVTYPID